MSWRVRMLVAATLLASSVGSVPALAAGAPVERASPQQVEEAQKEFQAGDELFDVQRYEEAIVRYRASYDIVASPNSRLMVARSFQELGKLSEAYREYELVLRESEALMRRKPAYAETARAARDELTALRSRVGFLKIDLGDVPPDSEITVGGDPVSVTAGQPIVHVPGKVEVVATAPDGRVARAEVQLAAGRERSVVLKLDGSRADDARAPDALSAPQDDSPSTGVTDAPETETAVRGGSSSTLRLGSFVLAGLGVAGLTTFGVFGAMNNATFAELEDACPNGACPEAERDQIDRGRRQQTIANVGAAVGIVGLGVGATLFVLSTRQRRSSEISLVAGPGAIGIRGRFQ